MNNIYVNPKLQVLSNQKVYYSLNSHILIDKISSIFEFTNIVYDKKVVIITDDEILEKKIVCRDKNVLITDDNEIIPFSSIRNIKEVDILKKV